MTSIQCSRRAFLLSSSAAGLRGAARLPNFVFILADDQGYGDLGCYGSTDLRTPNVDKMAAGGVRFTSFYAAPVCTPSRTSIMTGCYAVRVGLGDGVLFPYSKIGINSDEVTLPELLKTRGYSTAIVGKWHLGHQPKFLPRRHGFDYYFGTPYSNDMNSNQYKNPEFKAPPLPLMRNDELIEQNPDQNQLTKRYTNEAIQFIRNNKERPFFLYLAHNMPHLPLAASEKFRDKSKRGIYGDAVEEVDWSVGEVLRELRELGLENDTLVLYTSDNGPARQAAPMNGSAGPLRGRKASTWEGGLRVPCIVRWPGKVPVGRTRDEIVSTMDVLPTFAKLAGAALPSGRKIDGVDVWPLMSGAKLTKPPRETFYYFQNERLQAVRNGRWKLHVDRPDLKEEKMPLLYDLDSDIGEKTNVASAHPEVVKRLMVLLEQARGDLGDKATGVVGAGVRPAGSI
jgi:arylsulfatase A